MLQISKLILAIILTVSVSALAGDTFQDRSITYLLDVFSKPKSPKIIHSKTDELLGYYIQLLKAYPDHEAQRIAQVGKLAITYYEAKLAQAPNEKLAKQINQDLLDLLSSTIAYFEIHPNAFSSIFFERAHNIALMNSGQPTEPLTEDELIEQSVRKQVFRTIKDYLKRLDQQILEDITYGEENEIRIMARPYTPREEERIEGNIIYIGKKLKEETIFTINIVKADEYLEDIYTPAIEALLDSKKTYGVLFESRDDIPYNLDLKNLLVTKAGGTQILIRKLPENGTCKQYFTP